MKFKYIFPVFQGILISTTLISCENKTKPDIDIVRNVLLTRVETSGQTRSMDYAGVVEEGKSVNAAFMTGGKLATLNVKEGDRVHKGQLLASLDDTDYQIGVSQLQIQFDQMTAEKKRMDEMYARHNVAPNDYEKFEAGYRQLALQLEMAKNKLGYTKLYSPSNGFISFKYMQPGELVDAGTPIYKVTDDSSLEVAVDLPLGVYLDRNEITKVYGSVPSVSGDIPLKVNSFTPDADNNQLYHLRLDVPRNYSGQLTTGMNMNVNLEMKNDVPGETLVPSRAIFDNDGSSFVWVFNPVDSTLSKKQVSVIGPPQGNKSMVTGLEGSEQIVATGVRQLREGEKVNIASNPF